VWFQLWISINVNAGSTAAEVNHGGRWDTDFGGDGQFRWHIPIRVCLGEAQKVLAKSIAEEGKVCDLDIARMLQLARDSELRRREPVFCSGCTSIGFAIFFAAVQTIVSDMILMVFDDFNAVHPFEEIEVEESPSKLPVRNASQAAFHLFLYRLFNHSIFYFSQFFCGDLAIGAFDSGVLDESRSQERPDVIGSIHALGQDCRQNHDC
jgi:hypothetical protein